MKLLLFVALLLALTMVMSGCGPYYGGHGRGHMVSETPAVTHQSIMFKAAS